MHIEKKIVVAVFVSPVHTGHEEIFIQCENSFLSLSEHTTRL